MAMNGDFSREVRFEIVEEIGVIASHTTGWRKELNLVSWNGGQPKYDIRDWSPDHEHMSRGVTLHEKEMRHIFELLKQRRHNDRRRRPQETAEISGKPEDTEARCGPVSSAAASSAPAPPPSPPLQSDDDFDDMEINQDGEVMEA